MKKELILITGGAGFIGSHVNKMLHRYGYQTVVVDNLCRGSKKAVPYGIFLEGDIADTHFLDRVFGKYSIQAVMHFAAHIDVGESVRAPADYYQNNVSHTLNLLMAMVRHRVNKFIFSSSAAIYGHPCKPAIAEDHPCRPISPYGLSKWMIEKILSDFENAYGLASSSLRYFNAAGGDSEGEIKNYQTRSSNLIPRLLLSIKEGKGEACIYGTDYPTEDGTCIRDYVHVEDLGKAHIAAMEELLAGGTSTHYNLGSGHGYSVRQVIRAVEEVVNSPLSLIEHPRRQGDPAVLLADFSKAEQKLGWKPRWSLYDMIEHAWRGYEISRMSKESAVTP